MWTGWISPCSIQTDRWQARFRRYWGLSDLIWGLRRFSYTTENQVLSACRRRFHRFYPPEHLCGQRRVESQSDSGRIVDGRYNLWMPGGAALNEGTRFLFPVPESPLPFPPRQAGNLCGAYNSRYQAYADFSGRGFTRVTNMVKPDIAAPGVDITTASPNGGYTSRTGTSFATPFVTARQPF